MSVAPTISNYGELKTAIADWYNRTDLTDRIPDFIGLFESKVNRAEMRGVDNFSYIERSVSSGSVELQLSTTFGSAAEKEVRGISFYDEDNNKILANTSPMKLASEEEVLCDQAVLSSGKPTKYFIRGNSVIFNRAFDGPYILSVSYFYSTDLYSASQTGGGDDVTNWLLRRHPDVYLYGALHEAAIYLRDPRKAELEANAANALASLAEFGERQRFGGPLTRGHKSVI